MNTLPVKSNEHANLVAKYNVQAPRYTSYPTVPYWDKETISTEEWMSRVKSAYEAGNNTDGMSIYIHLPYCESLCTYCACNTRITVNHAVELPYIHSVLKEWEIYLKRFNEAPVIREIHLGGGTPTFFTAANLELLIGSIISAAAIHPSAEFSFEAHPANTGTDHLETLYKLGFRRVSFGIQDFDPKVQDIINRYQSPQQVEYCVREARRIGYSSVNFDLVYGLPLQTQSGLVATLEEVKRLRPDRIAFYNYAHVPWVKPGQRKFTEKDLPEGAAKQALYESGRKHFLTSGYKEIGMDHFALPSDSLFIASENGNLHRNFMGYTHQYTRLMIGLGVSSISDTWDAYMQNVKVVEEYQSLVNSGVLPLFKGHLLNREDLVIRRHILNIMCRFETSWDSQEELFDGLDETLLSLKEAEADGLIELYPCMLRVTDRGRGFLRNICMAFDMRLRRNMPETAIFSKAM